MQSNTAESTPPEQEAPEAPSSAAEEAALTALLQKHAPGAKETRPDVLEDRFAINLGAPLPEFTSPMAQAYEARDEKDQNADLYALICSNHYAYRQKALAVCREFSHPHFVKLHAFGPVQLSSHREWRMAMVFEKPKGKKLSALFAEKKSPFPERVMAEHLLAPIHNIVQYLNDAGITHGRINLDNIYFGDKVMLGECVSEPCGYSQPFYFEPPERMASLPLGKGEGDKVTDSYALGVLALHLVMGGSPFAQVEKEQFLAQAAQNGAYATITGARESSDFLQDLFRGTLNDHKHERWSCAQIKAWLEGKHFNLIPPALGNDAPRPFEFAGQEYVGRKALANAFFTQWDFAKKELRDNKLARWIELSAHKAELTEMMQRISRAVTDARGDKQQNEMVARTIVVLDPFGPLRMKNVACAIDGLGSLMADSFKNNRQQDLGSIAEIIENDLPNLQNDLQKIPPSPNISGVVFKLQRVRIFLRSTGVGGGMERCLYDLNPQLPCQSPLLLKYHVQTLAELMQTLDRIAPEQAKKSSPVDRHIAAFIASQLETAKEVKLPELANFPALVNHPDLIAMKLLAQAQEKSGQKHLRGLSAWMGMRLLDVLDLIHNRSVRQKLRKQILKAAESGKLENFMTVLVDPRLAHEDQEGFQRAYHRYQQNLHVIAQLKDEELIRKSARKMGLKISITLAYGALFFSSYMVLKEILNW